MNYLTFNKGRNWSPMAEFRREMDRFFDDSWGVPAAPRGMEEREVQWAPACDVEEADNHYMITLELAGVPKDQVKVEFHEDQLVVSGERRQETKRKEEGQWYSERRFGKFQRTFTLPAGVDPEKVEAHFQDGVLRVFVPKAESAKPREIKIHHGSEAGFFGRLLGTSKKEPEADRVA